MSEFSIKDAALSGFRLARSKPALLIVLALFSLIVSVALTWFTVATAGPAMVQLREMQEGGSPDPALAMRLLVQTLPVIAVSALVSLVMFVVNAAAVNRVVLRPDEARLPFISFAGDEFRLTLVSIVVGIIFAVIYMICSLFIGLAMFMTITASGGVETMAENPGQLPMAARVTTYVGVAITVAILFLFGAKFSLAPPQTVREKATRIFASWGLTKGRYWRIVAVYLLAFVFLIPFIVLACAILGAVAAATPDGVMAMMSVLQPDYSNLATAFSPLMLAYHVVSCVLTALANIVLLGAAAHIYQAVADADDEDVF